MSKRTLAILVLVLGVVVLAKGVTAEPKAVPAYQIQQQDQDTQAFKVQGMSKI